MFGQRTRMEDLRRGKQEFEGKARRMKRWEKISVLPSLMDRLV
jgi:hypothetical protein